MNTPSLSDTLNSAERTMAPPRRKRRWWRLIGKVVGGLLLALAGVVFTLWDTKILDTAPPDDVDMRPVYTGAAEHNPLADLEGWLQGRDLREVEACRRASQGLHFTWTPQHAEDLARFGEEFARLDALVQTDPDLWRYRRLEWRAAYDSHEKVRDLGYLSELRIQLMIEEQRIGQAQKQYRDLVKFGQGLQRAQGITVSFIDGLHFQDHGALGFLHALRLGGAGADELQAWYQELGREEPREDDVRFFERMQYVADLATIPWVFQNRRSLFDENQCAGGDRDPSVWFSSVAYMLRWGIKPNRTATAVLGWRRKMLEGFDQGWPRLTAIPRLEGRLENGGTLFQAALVGNVGGCYLSASWREKDDRLFMRFYQTVAWQRMVRLQLALRVYELRRGKLPTLLTEVDEDCPGAASLRDPFAAGRQPFRWLPDKGILYSVGTNGVDDGGKIDSPAAMDFGLKYEWRSEEPPSPQNAKPR